MKQLKSNSKILYYGAIAVLFLYAFRNVFQGIDVTDTGYHFSNFLYMSEMDPMWIFSTYLASVLGHVFTLLPGGNTLLGINIYTALVPAILGVCTYIFLVKVVKTGAFASFVATIVSLSLCWCPTTCLYNYMTYLFFGLGAMFLYKGLDQDKKWQLVLAGVFLGLNVLVRFPNAAEAALVLVVWYVCFLNKCKFKEYVQKTAWCLLGYVLGMGIVFTQIHIQYGIGEYVNGILRLFGMTDNASDYTAYSMVYNIIQAYLFSAKWFIVIAVCVVLGIIGFMVWPGKFKKIKIAGYAACCLVLVRWFYGQGMFNLVFPKEGYDAILNWGVMFLMAAIVFGLYVIVCPKADKSEKIMAAIVLIIIGITPLGSNNQLYSNLNNMFLVLPFVFDFLYKRLSKAESYTLQIGKYPIVLSTWPMRVMSIVLVAVLCFQTISFGNTFVFRDSRPRTQKVTSIESLKYMKTNENNAKLLEELGTYVTDRNLTGKSVLLYGDVPALSAYLRMPFVMSPWPELPSYSSETFEIELAKVVEGLSEDRPVIILSSKFYNFLTNLEENVKDTDYYKTNEGFKLTLLRDMIQENNYNKTFENEGYVIFE